MANKQFYQALGLLHSQEPDSTEQLKQLMNSAGQPSRGVIRTEPIVAPRKTTLIQQRTTEIVRKRAPQDTLSNLKAKKKRTAITTGNK